MMIDGSKTMKNNEKRKNHVNLRSNYLITISEANSRC